MPQPPEPFEGLVPVASFGTKIEADVALGALRASGIDATLLFDPALNSVAPFVASDRTYDLVVRADVAEEAQEVLERATTGLPEAFSDAHALDYRVSPRRRRARRVGLVLVLIWFGGPILLLLMAQLLHRSGG